MTKLEKMRLGRRAAYLRKCIIVQKLLAEHENDSTVRKRVFDAHIQPIVLCSYTHFNNMLNVHMIQPLLNLYQKFEENKDKFEQYNLSSDWFIDVYRSQPLEPELYEYFSLPAMFVDYQLTGQGKNKTRLVTMTLHIVTDEMPDASNISIQRDSGLKRFLYHTIIQKILEGSQLGNSSPLKFVSENIVDAPVINYHNQIYEFEIYLDDISGTPEDIEYGFIELLKLQGRLLNQLDHKSDI